MVNIYGNYGVSCCPLKDFQDQDFKLAAFQSQVPTVITFHTHTSNNDRPKL